MLNIWPVFCSIFSAGTPNRDLVAAERTPLIQKNPLLFWKLCSFGLVVLALYLLYLQLSIRP